MKKIVVVGLGNISHRHRKNIKTLDPEAWVIAVPSRKRTIDEVIDHADEVIEDLDSLKLDGITNAIIASPPSYHMRHASIFIKKNIDILIEKPLASSLDHAMAIYELSANSNSKIFVAYCLRFNKALNQLKTLLDSSYIGNLKSCEIYCGQNLKDWRAKVDYKDTVSAKRELGGGVVNELSHEIDYAQYLFGNIKILSSELTTQKYIDLDVEDTANIEGINHKGMKIDMHLNFTQKKPERYCRIKGEKGVLELNLIDKNVVYSNGEVKTIFNSSENDDMYLDMFRVFFGMGNKNFGKQHLCSLENSIQVLRNIAAIKNYS